MYHHQPPNMHHNVPPPHGYPIVDPEQHYMLQQQPLLLHPQQYTLSPVGIDGSMTPQLDFTQPQIPFFMVQDGSHSHGSKTPRRRRSGAGAEPIKHRRTRSGCYTCRQRRVKCDETHPICERCQKGGRECTYPEIVPNQKSTAKKRERERQASREGSSSLEDVEEEDEEDNEGSILSEGLQVKQSKSGPGSNTQRRPSMNSSVGSSGRYRMRKQSPLDPSPSPHDREASLPRSPNSQKLGGKFQASLPPEWDHLPKDVAFYLNYHRHRITFHHYLMKQDDQNFFNSTLFDYALKDNALVYAVAAFASFHHSVQFQTGVFHTFLEYYNKAVVALRASLDPEKPRTVTTLVTILQLASFEEYLGDWTSLMEHRNAAAKIITSIWTPEGMASTLELRMIYNWFIHFDVISSMMAGHKTALGIEWSTANLDAVIKHLESNRDDLPAKLEYTLCTFREMAVGASVLTAKRSQSAMTMEEFVLSSEETLQNAFAWWDNVDQSILDGPEIFKFSTAGLDNDDTCPFEPAPIHTGMRWGVNFMILDYYALVILLKHQIALANTNISVESLADYAIKICEIVAGFEACPDAPPGHLLSAQAALGLAALWIPNKPNYWSWVRKQMAKIEQMGFIYPLAFRNRMATLWGDERIKNTWVTDDSETPIGLTIRKLVDMRDAERQDDPKSSDIREMRSLMSDLRLESKGSGIIPKHAHLDRLRFADVLDQPNPTGTLEGSGGDVV